ncbi:TPA: hypothetical protein ACN8VT_002842, partial [Staphylococcus aureus]
YSDNILVKLFISEIVHTEDSFLLKLYYKFNFATEPFNIILIVSLIMIIFLFFINRSKNISYDYIKVQRGEANE